MESIDKKIVIAANDRLPPSLREAFGRIIRLQEDKHEKMQGASHLMGFAGKVQAFKDIDDPVAWQRGLRDSWKRE